MSHSDDRQDTVSDPEQGAGEPADWAGEGGAIPSGPATDPEDADPDAADSTDETDETEQPGSLGGDNGGA